MTGVVSDNLLWNSEASDDLVENEKRCSFSVSFEGRHCRCPLGEVINNDNDIFVPPSQNWIARHVIHPPRSEGAHHNDGKQWIRMRQQFLGVEMTRMMTLHNLQIIFKDHGLEITGA